MTRQSEISTQLLLILSVGPMRETGLNNDLLSEILCERWVVALTFRLSLSPELPSPSGTSAA
jgi:hypothetical protein